MKTDFYWFGLIWKIAEMLILIRFEFFVSFGQLEEIKFIYIFFLKKIIFLYIFLTIWPKDHPLPPCDKDEVSALGKLKSM